MVLISLLLIDRSIPSHCDVMSKFKEKSKVENDRKSGCRLFSDIPKVFHVASVQKSF